ncbi:hypothetical protein [Desulfoscipio gibsoniae]|uniref:hypothetical protein n=1 Tax=Desulfoscipio gibsoniae TaxID=102134 RepID=UPI0002D2BFFF|nr:hypothetical protein [Desulfoscipio gibsoniae]
MQNKPPAISGIDAWKPVAFAVPRRNFMEGAITMSLIRDDTTMLLAIAEQLPVILKK